MERELYNSLLIDHFFPPRGIAETTLLICPRRRPRISARAARQKSKGRRSCKLPGPPARFAGIQDSE